MKTLIKSHSYLYSFLLFLYPLFAFSQSEPKNYTEEMDLLLSKIDKSKVTSLMIS